MADPDTQTIPEGSNPVGDSGDKEGIPQDAIESEGQEQRFVQPDQGIGEVPFQVQRKPRCRITDNKFCLLLWKNYVLQKRHMGALIAEVFIIPILFICMLSAVGYHSMPGFTPNGIPLLLTLTFIYPVANICKSIVYEKEKRLKESMKMMGLSEWLHWSAWIAKSFLFLGITAILLTLAYKSWVLEAADPILLFVFLMSYVFSSITFAFLVASICSKSTSSLTACSFLYFLSIIGYMVVRGNYYSQMSTLEKLACSLVNNLAMGFGVDVMAKFEWSLSPERERSEGIQWSTIANSPPFQGFDDDLSLLHVIGMLILDGFLYLFLAIYVGAVFPGEYGVPLPFWFPFMPSYWCERRRPRGNVQPDNATQEDTEFFEKEPENLNAGIQIRGLKKMFGRKVAVDGLTLNFYENQVTALLGHNGAGKTTTMSVLTGLYPPTWGTALVNGFDIRKDMKSAQNSLGLCPQHDVLFDEMTVEEHLKFFCKLKGYALPVEPEINRMLVALNLVNKRYAQSKTLSGGMKRKLSVGIALIGGSKVVLLDEPTAGMDPGARRSTWDLISGEKEGKTILLSTHFMDEADLLGDRIAILAHGKAVCCGSSLFLKKKYGGGYHLIMVKEPNCQVNKITELLQKYIPEVVVDQNVGTELSYSLPEKKVFIFPDMFEELEKRKAELGIASYGCSITTMEEVFMRVGEQVEAEQYSKQFGQVEPLYGNLPEAIVPDSPELNVEISQPETPTAEVVSDEPFPPKVPIDQEVTLEINDETEVAIEVPSPPVILRNRGFGLHLQQLRAMLVKKLIYTWRKKFTYLILAAVPVVLFTLILLAVQNQHNSNKAGGLGGTVSIAIVFGILIALLLTFTMSFFTAGFLLFPIKEREVNSKHLQFVSGVPILTFWLGHFINDMSYYLIVSILLTIGPIAISIPYLSSLQSIWAFFLVLIFYGWAVIPMTYLFSFLYTVPSTGYTRTAFFYLIFGYVAVGVGFIYWPPWSLLRLPVGFFPNYNLFFGLVKIMGLDAIAPVLKGMSGEKGMEEFKDINFFGWGSIYPFIEVELERGDRATTTRQILSYLVLGKHLFYLFITGLICLIVLFLVEIKVCSSSSHRSQNAMNFWDPMMLEDSDVTAENERIRNGNLMELCMSETMVLKNLTKYYESFLAVDNVCLGVQHGECFGLLGINGAGKTTVFKMLTGELRMSSGDAFINGKSVSRQIKEVQRLIGYCPQFDALIPELTGRETIRMFARLRGIREYEINELINTLATDLLLWEHVAKPCGTYSGGNKRKLSSAISLIGNPSMVFLDEPTAGLDPVARRYLWNAIIKVRESGSSVVLTSHSMEECEALCTRVAIMVNGRFRCLGSTQHLKNKFGDGYTLIAQMPAASNEEQPDLTRNQRRTSLETGRRRESLNGAPLEPWEAHIQPLRMFIEENFTDCQLKDMHPCYVHYHIPMGSISWAQMFRKMEEAKSLFQLEAYSIGQTSLEQVFLGFAKGQYNAND